MTCMGARAVWSESHPRGWFSIVPGHLLQKWWWCQSSRMGLASSVGEWQTPALELKRSFSMKYPSWRYYPIVFDVRKTKSHIKQIYITMSFDFFLNKKFWPGTKCKVRCHPTQYHQSPIYLIPLNFHAPFIFAPLIFAPLIFAPLIFAHPRNFIFRAPLIFAHQIHFAPLLFMCTP